MAPDEPEDSNQDPRRYRLSGAFGDFLVDLFSTVLSNAEFVATLAGAARRVRLDDTSIDTLIDPGPFPGEGTCALLDVDTPSSHGG